MKAIWLRALSDLRAGFALSRVWVALAREDVGEQHRRTALGPIWMLLNYLAFVATFLFVFHRGVDIPGYIPFTAIGLLVWFHFMEVVTNALTLFPREEGFIKGTTLPLTVYVMRLSLHSVIRAGYAFAGCVGTLLLAGAPLFLGWAWSLIGIFVILAITPALVFIFAFVGSLLPDTQFIVSNLMRLGMFVTPVLWMYSGADGIQRIFYYWNPFTYLIAAVRDPVITGALPILPLAASFAIATAAWIVGAYLLGKFGKGLVFIL